jgi:hypothetical protein
MPATEAEFTKMVDAVLTLIDEKVCHLVISNPYGPRYISVIFDTEHSQYEDWVQKLELFSMGEDTLGDVEHVLSAVVASADPNDFARHRAEAEDEDEAVATAKFELIRKRFDLAPLRAKRWIKQTSKVAWISGLEWDVAAKVADDDYPNPHSKPVHFATVRLASAGPRRPNPITGETARSEVVVTVDRDDVGVLRRFFQRLDNELSKAEADGPSESTADS